MSGLSQVLNSAGFSKLDLDSQMSLTCLIEPWS